MQTDETIYCFCDERDGCNSAERSLISLASVLFLCYLTFLLK